MELANNNYQSNKKWKMTNTINKKQEKLNFPFFKFDKIFISLVFLLFVLSFTAMATNDGGWTTVWTCPDSPFCIESGLPLQNSSILTLGESFMFTVDITPDGKGAYEFRFGANDTVTTFYSQIVNLTIFEKSGILPLRGSQAVGDPMWVENDSWATVVLYGDKSQTISYIINTSGTAPADSNYTFFFQANLTYNATLFDSNSHTVTITTASSPSVESIGWRTDGGFTDDTLLYLQELNNITAVITDDDGNDTITHATVTVTNPDSTTIWDNYTMSNTTSGDWYNDTVLVLNKNGTWTIQIDVWDNNGQTDSSTDTFSVSTNNLSLIDGWFGISKTNANYPTKAQIENYSQYGFDLIEIKERIDNVTSSWSDIKNAINDSKQLNIRVGLRFTLDFNYTNTSRRDELVKDLYDNADDLLATPYSEAMEYILFETINNTDYDDANLSGVCNEFGENITSAVDNDYVIYCTYNSSNLDTSYVQFNTLIYITETTPKGLMDELADTMRTNSSLNRVFIDDGTSMNSTLLNITKHYNTNILEDLTAGVNDTLGISHLLIAELNNGDLVIHNNDSSKRSYFFDITSGIDASGVDIWDATNDRVIEADTDGQINVTIEGYEAVLLLTENLDHIMLSENAWTVFKQSADQTGHFNWTNKSTGNGNWGLTDANRARTRLWNPNFQLQGDSTKTTVVFYGQLDAGNTGTIKARNPEGYEQFKHIIISDTNNTEITKLINNTDALGIQVDYYISVSNYNGSNTTWVQSKLNQVDEVYARNNSLGIFANGLDAATINNATKFAEDMKNLTDYIEITKGMHLTMNVYTQSEVFSQWASKVMKESCIYRWNGDDANNPDNYSREDWSLDKNKSEWYQNHNVETICMIFTNTTNQSLRYEAYLMGKLLGHDNVYVGTPDFQDVNFDYFPNLGDDLANSWSQTGDLYSRRFSNGIVYYNHTTGLAWFDDGKVTNEVRIDVLMYGALNEQMNFTVNGGEVRNITNEQAFIAGGVWHNYTLNATDIYKHGLYELNFWGDTMTMYWDNAIRGQNRHSYYSTDSGSTWTIYDPDKNWVTNIYINETVKSSVDTTDKIEQFNSSRVANTGDTNLTLNSTDDYNITVWSDVITVDGGLIHIQVQNGSGYQDIAFAEQSDCDSSNPTFTTTTVGTDSYGACKKTDSGGTTEIRISIPHLSEHNVSIQSNNAPNITSLNLSQSVNDLVFVYGFYDADGDTEEDNETRWSVDGVENSTFANFSFIESENLTLGENWTVSYRVYDGINWSVWLNSSLNITSLNIAPRVVGLNPSNGSYSNNRTLVWNWTDDDSNNVTFYLEIDGNSTFGDVDYANNTLINGSLTDIQHTWAGLTDGTWYWRVLANDGSVNGSWTDNMTFTYDSTEITISLNSPSNGYSREEGDLNFQYTPTDTNLANCTLIILDGRSKGNTTNTSALTSGSAYDEYKSELLYDSYRWYVQCVDLANNINISAVNSFTLTERRGGGGSSGGGGGSSLSGNVNTIGNATNATNVVNVTDDEELVIEIASFVAGMVHYYKATEEIVIPIKVYKNDELYDPVEVYANVETEFGNVIKKVKLNKTGVGKYEFKDTLTKGDYLLTFLAKGSVGELEYQLKVVDTLPFVSKVTVDTVEAISGKGIYIAIIFGFLTLTTIITVWFWKKRG